MDTPFSLNTHPFGLKFQKMGELVLNAFAVIGCQADGPAPAPLIQDHYSTRTLNSQESQSRKPIEILVILLTAYIDDREGDTPSG
jgi:hypothetical protein